MTFVTNKPMEFVLQGQTTYSCKLTAMSIEAFLNMDFPKSMALDLLPNSGRLVSALQRKCANMMNEAIEFNPKNEVYLINRDATHVIKMELA